MLFLNHIWLIPLFPAFGAAIMFFFGRRLQKATVSAVCVGVVVLAFLFACFTVVEYTHFAHGSGRPFEKIVYTWLGSGDGHLNFVKRDGTLAAFNADAGFLLDPLSSIWLLFVTGVGMLIHIYSTGYMAHEGGYYRFFGWLNLFMFSMLTLILANNYVLMFVGWEGVGLCSYLLIGFYFHRKSASDAANKAFIVNRIGDAGFLLGMFFIAWYMGSLRYIDVTAAARSGHFAIGDPIITAATLLLFVGACGKSAQIPLYVWLPDAMEGPTPVSALIHAATMVTAGVYLIARMHVLFELAPAAQDTGAVIGALTLLIAGTIALTQTDIKRVIAYSTMSQIGYMIMGVSVGAYAAGMFHLMTHAFFKALLFMGAGSIIGAMGGEQSLEKMGGFRKALPFTFACFIIGGLALSGIPPFSGFFSKDEILLLTAERGSWHWALYVVGYIGAFLTAIYTFRMIFRAFHGEPVAEARELEGGHPAHAEVPTNPATGEIEDTDVGFPGPTHAIAERSPPMRVAMVLLALGALGAGLVQIPKVDFVIDDFLRPSFATSKLYEPHTRSGLLVVGLTLGTLLGLAGIALAYRIWVVGGRELKTSTAIRERAKPLYTLFVNKWYFDELIDLVVVRPVAAAGDFARDTFERVFVDDTLIGGTTGIVRAGSAAVRAAQSGFVRYYAALLVLGVTGVGLYFLLQA